MSSETAGARLRRRQVDANDLTFECLRVGDGDRLALCLHGFPDNAGSMLPILWRLADAGFTAVAPFMRGYAPTDPAPTGDYSVGALGRDAIALAHSLEAEFETDGAVLVGHDWGGCGRLRGRVDRFRGLLEARHPRRAAGVRAAVVRVPSTGAPKLVYVVLSAAGRP